VAQPADVPYYGDLFDKWRREEALWLQREDVALAASTSGMIRVQAKTVNGESWQPKTKVNRAVPVSRALRAYPDSHTPRPSFGDWSFPSTTGSRYDVDNFSQDLRAANQKAGLPWTCLTYRHTFGSQLAVKGESLYKIATLVGNSPEICRRHYAAIIPEGLAGVVKFAPSCNDFAPHPLAEALQPRHDVSMP
jgi:integrase